MARRPYDEYEWTLGRLDEGEADVKQIFGRRSGFSAIRPAVYALPSSPPKRLSRNGITPFHLHHGKPVVKAPAPPVRDLETSRQKYPGRHYVRAIAKGGSVAARAAGGKYDRGARCWWIPMGTRLPANLAEATMAGRRPGRVLRQGAARSFQRYIDRGDPDASEEVDRDEIGPLALGNIAPTPEERLDFWSQVEKAVKPGGRVQMRIDAEFPYQLDVAARRRILARFISDFEGRGLPVWGVVHVPEVKHGTDRRNYHAHIVYLDRAVERRGPGEWVFAATKDREAQGPGWVKALRAGWSDAVNAELEKAGAPVRYHPGSYEKIGIGRLPSVHLGPQITALERSGMPTGIGVANAMIESRYVRAELWAERSERLGEMEWARRQAERVNASDLAWPELREKARNLDLALGQAEGAAVAASEDAEAVAVRAGKARIGEEEVYLGWAVSERDLVRRAAQRRLWARRELAKLGPGSNQRGFLDRLEQEAVAAESQLRKSAVDVGLRRAEPGLGGDASEALLEASHERVLAAWRALRDEAEKKRLEELEREEKRLELILRSPRHGRPFEADQAGDPVAVASWRRRLGEALTSLREAEAEVATALAGSNVSSGDAALFGIPALARSGDYDLDRAANWILPADERRRLEMRMIGARSRALRLAGDIDPPGKMAPPEEREILVREIQRLRNAREAIRQDLAIKPGLGQVRAIPAEQIRAGSGKRQGFER